MDYLIRTDDFTSKKAVLKVVGVGGGGCNAVDRMIEEKVGGVEFIAINTDAQSLLQSKAPTRLCIGNKLTRGLGCGGNPACGEKAAQESAADIKAVLEGANMVFVTAGMGGGTGTGGAPLVAQIAKQLGALTVAVVTKPFGFEGLRRMKVALEGIERLRNNVDTMIVIPNDRLLQILPPKASIRTAFLKADDILRQGIQGISELVVRTGMINVDFNDVRTIMENGGSALMAIGRGKGETRAMDAIMQAINSDLLEVSIEGARAVLLNFKGGPDMSLHEIYDAAAAVQRIASPEANIKFGADQDESMGDEIQITVIATGFDAESRPAAAKEAAPQAERESKIIKLPPRETNREELELPPWIRRGLS